MENFLEKFLHHRKLVIAIFAVAVIVSGLCIPLVKVNYSMTDYLPEDAESVQALDEMEASFDGGIPNAKLYAEGITLTQADKLSQELADIDGISDVMWLGSQIDIFEPDSMQDEDVVSTWESENGYLYQFVVDGSKGVSATAQARETAQDVGATNVSLSGDAVNTANAQSSTSVEIIYIMAVAVLIIILILLLSSNSWFEPVIFLVVIGVAIVMNMGTNLILGEISFISQIVGAVLQLAVSMDYAIVLLHTFRRAQREFDDPEVAMAHAMKRGFTVVLSSAAVTFFGFLSLCVMRFGIGVNMGIVLSKGIIFSFLSVMFLMPCLTLCSLKPLNALQHKYLLPSFDKFGSVCGRIMIPSAIIIVLIAVPCFFGQNATSFVYGSGRFASPGSQAYQENEYIHETFGNSETWVVMVPEGETSKENELIKALKDLDDVDGVTSYITVAGRAMPTSVVGDSTLSQIVSNGWSRIVLTLDLEDEGEQAFSDVEKVRETCASYYGDDYELVGNLVSTYDLKNITTEDSGRVKAFSMIAIGIVLALMFKSISIPFVVLIAIEFAIWINLAVPYFMGEELNYIGYLVIDSVQLGSAVDYAIIYAREYFDRRATHEPYIAACSAVKHSAITILTSALILMFAGIAVHYIASNGVISELGTLVARGAFCSMCMMFLFLPFLFRVFDGLIQKTTFGLKFGNKKAADSAA